MTITFTPSVDKSYDKAEFVYALIVDNDRIETPVYKNNNTEIDYIANDDGDGITESVQKNGGAYEWSISINSKDIPDGPVVICCVAIDKAGNISDVTSVTTSVQNNRPY